MIEIDAGHVTPALRSFFRTDAPQARRCFAVLDGVGHPGKILANDPINPTWAVVQEGYDGVIYLEGQFDAGLVAAIFAELRREGEMLACLYPNDPRLDLLPPDPYYDGWVLEFYDRSVGSELDEIIAELPADCKLRPLDRDLILRTQWGPDDVKFAGGLDAWEATCMGFCLMRGDQILCESTVGPPAIGLYEPGVITHEDHRGNGYATITCARLIQEIEAQGTATYWNCNQSNIASAAVARKLGYSVEKEARCLAWRQQQELPQAAKQSNVICG